MSEGSAVRPPARPTLGARLARDGVRYTVAVLGYIAIGFVTQFYLTFTLGLLYFVVVLEVLPRAYRWLRRRRSTTLDPVAEP